MPLPISCDGYDFSIFNPTEFKLIFKKIPNATFWCQSVVLPGVEMGEARQSTPYLDMFHGGEKPNFEMFRCAILLDKSFTSYREIFDWMKRISTRGNGKDEFSDASLIMGNVEYQFKEMFPVALSSLDLSIAVDRIEPLVFDAQFRYDYFDIAVS